MQQLDEALKPSLDEFFDSLFLNLQEDPSFDPDVVRLVIQHLGSDSIHSQAGKRLADAINALAKERSSGGNQ